MLNNILKNMNLFVDGRGFAGNVEEINLPKLTTQTEEFRGGGMDAPLEVDLGMEALVTDFKLTSFDAEVLKLYGLLTGQFKALTVRGAIEDELSGEVKPVVINMQGRIKEVDYGTWKAGEKAVLSCMLALSYYKLQVDGNDIHEVDVPNITRIIDGVDQLADRRAALGI